MATYTQREKTRLEHQWEIAREVGYRDFVDAEAELAVWVDDRAWTTGEGAVAVFNGAVGWLRERKVLLPGVTTLARLVARERDAATLRVWTELAQPASGGQARLLRGLLVVPDGSRRSEFDRMRTAETVTSGAGMVRALRRVSDVAGLRLGGLDLSVVPHRRVVSLARYGMAAKATALHRHPEPRRLATLVATVRSLEAKAVDDALELFDVLMTNDLLARAARESRNEKLRRYPRLSKDAGKLAAAVGVLLDALEHEEQLSLDLVWEEIESKVSRAELRAAVAHLLDIAPPADADPDGEWRTALIDRFASVRAFVPLFCETIEFGATAQAADILTAMADLPGLLDARATTAIPAGYLDARRIADDVVPAGWWRRLVYSAGRPEGTVDRAAYVFCVLEQFHRHLLRRDIYASPSARWGDPRAKLLTGPAWDAARGPALNALGLPEDPSELLAGHSQELDAHNRARAAVLARGDVLDVGLPASWVLAALEALASAAPLGRRVLVAVKALLGGDVAQQPLAASVRALAVDDENPRPAFGDRAAGVGEDVGVLGLREADLDDPAGMHAAGVLAVASAARAAWQVLADDAVVVAVGSRWPAVRTPPCLRLRLGRKRRASRPGTRRAGVERGVAAQHGQETADDEKEDEPAPHAGIIGRPRNRDSCQREIRLRHRVGAGSGHAR